MGRDKRITLVDLKVMSDKVMLEVNQLVINKGDYVLIRTPIGLERIGQALLADMNNALPGVFVSLTFEAAKIELKKIDDSKGDKDE